MDVCGLESRASLKLNSAVESLACILAARRSYLSVNSMQAFCMCMKTGLKKTVDKSFDSPVITIQNHPYANALNFRTAEYLIYYITL